MKKTNVGAKNKTNQIRTNIKKGGKKGKSDTKQKEETKCPKKHMTYSINLYYKNHKPWKG